MINNYKLDSKVVDNLSNVRLRLLLYPFLLLVIISFVLFKENVFTAEDYVNNQKDLFFYLNSKLSVLPNLQFNLTQLGDVLILFPFLTVFIIYAPKVWGTLITSSIITLIVCFFLKEMFAVPRPAGMFDTKSFVIIGKTLSGNTSLPSGHSVTTFTILTILLYAFMPKGFKAKTIWSFMILTLGAIIVFSRVGVGAHYPLDVIIGSIIGYICALVGIVIDNKVSWWAWIKNKKYYPIFILLLTIWVFVIVKEIFTDNLLIFYFSLLALITTLYLMIKTYVKK
ncbi:MAG: membrane-associated phospholipid phosphatase [Polaribacter sp.]|jgi:membrane-associated phospholipid phosphatase